MNQSDNLHLSLKQPLDCFRSIKIKVEYPKLFGGFLIYTREFYKDYNFESGDGLDEAILQFCKEMFSEASKGYSAVLIIEELYEYALKVTAGAFSKEINLNFVPNPDIELYEKLSEQNKLISFPIKLRMTFLINDQSAINTAVMDSYIIHYPFELQNKLRTIKKI